MPRKERCLSRLKRNIDYLNLICKSRGERRRNLTNSVDLDFICCVCEICANLVAGKIILSKSQRKRANKYWPVIQSFADGNIDTKEKLNSFRRNSGTEQIGGFIGSVLTPLAALLGGVIANAL